MAMWNEMRILEEMGRVFRLEIDTLNNVWKALDDNSTRAVEMLLNCQGKIVVTGMGKSGYIAQKIASTMVSTGTQAVFLHPGDGMHGDVGIIQERDVVIAISKSGESDELLSILLYAKNLGIPLIAITAQPSSTLAGRADLVLHTSGLPSLQPTIYFQANEQIQLGAGIPFGDGLRCAGGAAYRLGVRFADSNGSASWGPTYPNAPWSAGTERHFQAWYRNNLSPACGTGFNLSNGYTILFTP